MLGTTRGVMVSKSAFLACHQSRVRVRVSVETWNFGFWNVAFSEARRQGFSSGTPVSSLPLSLNGFCH